MPALHKLQFLYDRELPSALHYTCERISSTHTMAFAFDEWVVPRPVLKDTERSFCYV